jgi:MOSC domain
MPLLTKFPKSGKVTALLSRESRDEGFVKSTTGRMTLTLEGPAGDCHTGLTRKSDVRTIQLYKRNIDIRNVRQITVLSAEELADVAKVLGVPLIEPSWFGANMVLSGVPDLTLLLPSTRFQFPSGAVLVADMENLPCSQIAEVVAEHYPDIQFKVVKAAMHKRGLTAWVERGGEVLVGDDVTVWLPPNRLYPHMPEVK